MGIGPLTAPGPGFFPTLIGGLFSILSIALFIITFPTKDRLPEKRGFWKEKGSWKKVFLSLLSLVFYLISLDYLGYRITTFLFILFLLKFVGQRRWGSSILTAILVSLGSYAIFKTGLGVSLPKGLIKI
jgi:putative tricarboxylic transport membrane protein